jgi:hypothetical protein
MIGVYAAIIARIWSNTSKRGFTKIRLEHLRFAVADGIAECTPNSGAS